MEIKEYDESIYMPGVRLDTDGVQKKRSGMF